MDKFIKIIIALICLSFLNPSLGQDTNRTQPFKSNVPKDKTPIVKTKYQSYPLMTSFFLLQEANGGDPFAQHELGLRYLLGYGFEPDTIQAINWILRAVRAGIPSANYNYGILLMNGIGVEWNPFEAFKYFKYAAESGMPEAQYVMGLFYIDNLVVNRNTLLAYNWIDKSSKTGFKPAIETKQNFIKSGLAFTFDSTNGITQVEIKKDTTLPINTLIDNDWEFDLLGTSYDTTNQKEKLKTTLSNLLLNNKEKLIEFLDILDTNILSSTEDTSIIGILNLSLKYGNPQAYILIGKAHQEGILFNKDLVLAAYNYLRAIRLGMNTAAAYLLEIFTNPEFFNILKKAVDANNTDGMYTWALLVTLGYDYRLTKEQALDLLQRAGKMEHLPSIIEIGNLYHSSSLLPQDRNKAIEFWEYAKTQGSIEAETKIIFSKINLNSSISKEEFNFLKETADKGSILAMTALGYCYENGINTKVNLSLASKYYRTAARKGSEAAYNSLIGLYDKLRPPEEIFKIYE